MIRRTIRYSMILVVPVIFLLGSGGLHAQQARLAEDGRRAVQTFQRQLLGGTGQPEKCGLTAAMYFRRHPDQFSPAERLTLQGVLQRPDFLDKAYVSAGGHFKIHYTLNGPNKVDATSTNGEGVPDFVFEAGRVAERAYFVLVDSLGFRAPLADGGVDGPEYDIYIHDLGNVYGWTYTDSGASGSPPRYIAYGEVDNDFLGGFFTSGIEALRVTIAHEFFHAVQFSYGFRDEDVFFFEMSSVWFEEFLYDRVNDYLSYVPGFLATLDLPLNSTGSLHHYGSGLFLMYWLADRDLRSLRRMWEGVESSPALLSIEKEVRHEGRSMPDALAEFYGWCLYTGRRAVAGQYFHDAARFPEVRYRSQIEIESDTTATDSLRALSGYFYRFFVLPTESIVATVNSGEQAMYRLVAAPEDTLQSRLDPFAIKSRADAFLLPAVDNFGALAVAVVNGALPDDVTLPAYQLKYDRFTLSASSRLLSGTAEGLLPPQPNPFRSDMHTRVTLFFTIKTSQVLGLSILSETGVEVYSRDLGLRPAGPGKIFWDGRDRQGNAVPSGVYLAVLHTSDNARFLRKIAVIHP